MRPALASLVTAALLAATLLALAPGCSRETPAPPAASAAPALPDRDPALAHRLVAAGGVLLDVRSPDEYAGKHVDGAVNVPVDDIAGRLAEVEKLTGGDKKKPIVVYCQMGGRAARAKGILTKAGYEQVTNLGGVDDWDRK
jgi:rhodanese-related sulfurtransferase